MQEPLYKHDCDNCTYLGTDNKVDLYHCNQDGSSPTLIARYSDEGSNYISGISQARTNPDIATAMKVAEMMNLPLKPF